MDKIVTFLFFALVSAVCHADIDSDRALKYIREETWLLGWSFDARHFPAVTNEFAIRRADARTEAERDAVDAEEDKARARMDREYREIIRGKVPTTLDWKTHAYRLCADMKAYGKMLDKEWEILKELRKVRARPDMYAPGKELKLRRRLCELWGISPPPTPASSNVTRRTSGARSIRRRP